MRITPKNASDIETIYKEVKTDSPELPHEKRMVQACKLYNQRFNANIDTDDVQKALKNVVERNNLEDLERFLK